MFWLVIIIISYLFFSLTSLGDRYLLIGPPNPKVYTFYVGVLGGLVLFLVPFVGFSFLPIYQVFLCFLAGFIFIFALFALFNGLEQFEASRIIPAIGGLSPLFTLLLIYFFSGGKETLSFLAFLAFFFLVVGSVLITIKHGKRISLQSFKISCIAAFLFSLYFVLAKYVYILQPFWIGFIWIRIGAFITGIIFIFTKEVKKEIFKKEFTFKKKTGMFFVFNQIAAAGASVLQNWAIALAGLVYLPIINALQGIQYFFLFVFSVLISWKSPRLLEERISKKIIIRKTIAIIVIALGLVILAFL